MCQSIWRSGYGLLHESASVTFNKRETFGMLMHYEIELMYTLGIIAFKFICTIFSFIMIMMLKPGTGWHFVIKANSL